MTKNKQTSKSYPRSMGRRAGGWIIFLALLVGGGVSLMKVYPSIRSFWSLFSARYSHMVTWVAERKASFHRQYDPVIPQTKADPMASTIQFEFYTTLQEASVPLPAARQASRPASPSNRPAIVSAAELEQELSRQLLQPYIVQLGVFHTWTAAQRYQRALRPLNVHMAEEWMNKKKIYRIQVGPFMNLDQAEGVQKRLQKEGINGSLKKVSLYHAHQSVMNGGNE